MRETLKQILEFLATQGWVAVTVAGTVDRKLVSTDDEVLEIIGGKTPPMTWKIYFEKPRHRRSPIILTELTETWYVTVGGDLEEYKSEIEDRMRLVGVPK